MSIGWLALAAVSVAVFVLLGYRSLAIFVGGGYAGAYMAVAIIAPGALDGPTGRYTSGADAETWTAGELRRVNRDGWRAVHNLHFEAGDVDHVAVGPGGVVVIETKWSSADWSFLERQGLPSVWARQARRSAIRVAGLVKQRARVATAPTAVVVTWGQGQPDGPIPVGEGVFQVHGRTLPSFLRSLTPSLDNTTAATIHESLASASIDFDAAQGVDHPGLLRRMLE